jgi:predicted amidophosphoribosyltransferase
MSQAVPPPPLPGQLPRIIPGAGPLPGTMKRCPSCRKDVDAADQFCMHCGVQLVADVRRCPKCGAYPDLADQYCIFCGETLASNVELV